MRWPGVLFLGLVIILPARAEDWTTEDGKTYKNVTVLNQEDDGVRITYMGGVGKIPYYELSPEIQKRFGQDIESMAAKKKAVDQAIEDAVRNAIAAEQMKQPKEATAPVATHTPTAVPTPTPENPSVAPAPGDMTTTTQPNTTTPENPSANGAPNTAAPGAVMPGNTAAPSPGATPGNAANNNVTSPTNVAPNTPVNPTAATTTPGAAHGTPGVPGKGGSPGTLPANNGISGLNDYTPGHGGPSATPEELAYPGSKVTYNEALDLCYLDSPAMELVSVGPPAKVKATASLTLRVVTEGHKPAGPEKIEATYLLVGAPSQSNVNSTVDFNVDGKAVTIEDSAKKDSSTMGGPGQSLFYLTFYLTPEQLKTISDGKSVQVTVSPSVYKLNGNSMAYLQAYQKDIDGLPKAPSSILRSYYKMLAKIPSFVSILSTVCEYLILGSFALLVCASIAAFIMGVSRFIKM